MILKDFFQKNKKTIFYTLLFFTLISFFSNIFSRQILMRWHTSILGWIILIIFWMTFILWILYIIYTDTLSSKPYWLKGGIISILVCYAVLFLVFIQLTIFGVLWSNSDYGQNMICHNEVVNERSRWINNSFYFDNKFITNNNDQADSFRMQKANELCGEKLDEKNNYFNNRYYKFLSTFQDNLYYKTRIIYIISLTPYIGYQLSFIMALILDWILIGHLLQIPTLSILITFFIFGSIIGWITGKILNKIKNN